MQLDIRTRAAHYYDLNPEFPKDPPGGAGAVARGCSQHPNLNTFRKGSNLILLDDVTISVQTEREIAGEPMGRSKHGTTFA